MKKKKEKKKYDATDGLYDNQLFEVPLKKREGFEAGSVLPPWKFCFLNFFLYIYISLLKKTKEKKERKKKKKGEKKKEGDLNHGKGRGYTLRI